MNICKSSEDYLEMMLMLEQNKGYIKSIDIASNLGVTKPSVSYAVKRLKENGYINMDKSGNITLTEQGRSIAEEMYHRHKTITAMLMSLGIDEETACEDACKIEHDISEKTYKAMQSRVEESNVEHNCTHCSMSDKCIKQ